MVWGPCVSGQTSDLRKLRVDLWGDIAQQPQAAQTGRCLGQGQLPGSRSEGGALPGRVSAGHSSVPASCRFRDLRPACEPLPRRPLLSLSLLLFVSLPWALPRPANTCTSTEAPSEVAPEQPRLMPAPCGQAVPPGRWGPSRAYPSGRSWMQLPPLLGCSQECRLSPISRPPVAPGTGPGTRELNGLLSEC